MKFLSESKKGADLVGSNSKSIHPTKFSCSLQLSLFENIGEYFKMDDIKPVNEVHNRILLIVEAYQVLMNLDNIDEEQADILEKILTLSESNPILSHMLSIVDDKLPMNEDEISKEFSSHVKQEIGDDAYQAWREVRFM